MSPAPFAANLLVFGRALRAAGIAVTPGQSLDFARALEMIDLGRREQVFHAARCLFVSRKEELEVFALLFERFWRASKEFVDTAAEGGEPAEEHRGRNSSSRLAGVGLLGSSSEDEGPEFEFLDRAGTFSDREVLRHKDFSEMSAQETAELRRLILEMSWRASSRRTRRWRADSAGRRLFLRKILRDAARTGATPLRLAYRRRKTKQRPVVLLADISGSMEKYSRIVLQFFYGALHGLGAAEVECFVFGTRLTRITAPLRIRNVDRALERASAEILDWSGGTRIGESLGAFNRRWARRVLRRGAVVVVVSDGWERGEVSELRREMRHLHHRCHRLIWLNPHAGRAGYEPLVEGMSAALPFVDDFLPIHNLESLRTFSRALADLPSRKTRLPSGRSLKAVRAPSSPGGVW